LDEEEERKMKKLVEEQKGSRPTIQ